MTELTHMNPIRSVLPHVLAQTAHYAYVKLLRFWAKNHGEKDYKENACHLLLGAQPQTENYKIWWINV